MLITSRSAVFARVVLLPLLLVLAVVLGLGSYFETSDDGTLAWLFSGVLASRPVVSVPLYLHGYGHLLAAAYAVAPAVPWLGLLLAALLAGATALWFAVLERLLRPWLRPGWLTLALALFFGLAWLEHWLWFSHARVALLLAAGGVLFAAQRPGRRGPLLLALGALLAAWLVRPGLAGLAYGAVWPAVLLLAGSWRRAAPLLLSTGLLLSLAFGLAALNQTPAEARVQVRDARLARILDYEQLRPHPRTPADSLGTAAIGLWLLGDSTVVDPVLRGTVYRFEAADFWARVVPAKLVLRAGLLVRDYFPLLLGLLATAGAMVRRPGTRARGFWPVQLGFAAGLVALAGVLKLPPRLALPLLDCWLLTNLIFWLQTLLPAAAASTDIGDRAAPPFRRAGPEAGFFGTNLQPLGRFLIYGSLIAVVSLYTAKTWHRHQVLQRERYRHESALAAVSYRAGRVRVLAGPNDWLKSLSPFRAYSPGPGSVLLLSGWPAHDASQAHLRRALTGTPDQTECLRHLARRVAPAAEVVWLLTPETAQWLNRRSRCDGPGLQLVPETLPPPDGSGFLPREYRALTSCKP
ncbi:hypothetical protein [Hymenobacter sp. UYCo722]|uniref:hypothetical protein n=1 Tax=Hymenobacter sp. UYCo722 TaxID=3156335 RepID=UPI003396C043